MKVFVVEDSPIVQERLVDNAAAMGAYLQERLGELAELLRELEAQADADAERWLELAELAEEA